MTKVSRAHVRASDAYLKDANSHAQSERGRYDCALDSGYLALLSVLTADERDVADHPSERAVRLAAYRLKVDVADSLRLLRSRHSAEVSPSVSVALGWAQAVRKRVLEMESLNSPNGQAD